MSEYTGIKSKNRWAELEPGADENQEQRFQQWIAAEGTHFENDAAKAAYQERCTLIKDAVQMKRIPKRIPIWLQTGSFPLEYSGLQWGEAMYNYDAVAEAFIKYAEDFAPDGLETGEDVVPGTVLDLLGVKFARWAGHGVTDSHQYQYVEAEYMKGNEYQDLIDDPTGWLLNVYMPRVLGTQSGFSFFPNMSMITQIVSLPFFSLPFGDPSMVSALNNLISSGKEVCKWIEKLEQVSSHVMGKGHPQLAGGFSIAPFDVLGDTLRGTQEILLDLFRRSDQVLEACERLIPMMVKAGVQSCSLTGNPLCFIPLHKGSDGFMSNEQFRTFYWPSLRKLCIGLMDAGVVPMLFAEGGYNERLEAVDDLPAGKAIWYFDKTDMKKAKETVGQSTCIMGNVPVDILYAGTVADVEDYCRKLIDTAGPNGGYIFSTGAGCDSAKPENVRAMIAIAKQYGAYDKG